MNLFKSKYSDTSDEELMRLVRTESRNAFEVLYRRYSAKMNLYFSRMFHGNLDLGKDFTQDLFLKVFEKASYFNAEMKFSTWLYTLASNMCKNEFRREKIRNPVSLPKQGLIFNEEHERRIDLQSFNDDLYDVLDEVEYEHKSAFLLRYGSGLSIKEIAGILDCHEGTVKSRLYYTLKFLAKKLIVYKQDLNAL